MIGYYQASETQADRNGKDVEMVQCMFTGEKALNGTDKIIAAHLIPRKRDDQAFKSLCISPSERDKPRNALMLCKHIEAAFDKKQISFYENENGNYNMKVWDESVLEKRIYKGAEDTKIIGYYADCQLDFLDKALPYTRILNFHHKMCARHHGQHSIAAGPNFGTPCKEGGEYPVEVLAKRLNFYKLPSETSSEAPSVCSESSETSSNASSVRTKKDPRKKKRLVEAFPPPATVGIKTYTPLSIGRLTEREERTH